jgi:ABC-2 type transport system permease protein
VSWRRGVWLVAVRELVERARTRAFSISTVVLTTLGVAAVVLLPRLADGSTTYTLAVVGEPSPGLELALDEAAAGVGARVEVTLVASAAAAEARVTGEDVDGALVPGDPARLLVEVEPRGDLGAIVVQAASVDRLRAALDRAGVDPAEADALIRGGGVQVQALDPDADERDADQALAFAAAILMYLALLGSAQVLAGGVGEEKSSHVAAVLLPIVRPSQLLAGKVLGIGLLGFGQLLVVAGPPLIAAYALGDIDLPDATAGGFALVLLWFVLGYALYGCAFAAAGALVSRQEEVGSATMPLNVVLIAAYLLSAQVPADPDSTLARALSLAPPTAPLAMPPRAIAGDLAAWELPLAAALTAAAAVALTWLAGAIYAAGIRRTGQRLRLLDVLRSLRAG